MGHKGDEEFRSGGGGGGGGCFINTVAYNNYIVSEARLIGQIRDDYFSNRIGKIFLKWYYKVSPFLAKLIRK
jgi:hypothetical protein